MSPSQIIADPAALRAAAHALREHRRIPPADGWPQSCGGIGCRWIDESADQDAIRFDEHLVQVAADIL